MFLNKSNSWGSLYFTRKSVEKPTEVVSIDLLPSLPEKLRAERERKIVEKKVAIPGESLLKRLHKEQKKKKVVSESDDDDEMDRYTRSINGVMNRLNNH